MCQTWVTQEASGRSIVYQLGKAVGIARVGFPWTGLIVSFCWKNTVDFPKAIADAREVANRGDWAHPASCSGGTEVANWPELTTSVVLIVIGCAHRHECAHGRIFRDLGIIELYSVHRILSVSCTRPLEHQVTVLEMT